MDIDNLVYGLTIIGIGLTAGVLLSQLTKKLTKPFAGETRSKSLARVVQWLIVITFVLIGGLIIFGANSSSVAFIMGALTFALTFGLQNVIQNFVAGLLIASDGRVQVGQWVEIGDQPGQTGPAEVLDMSLQKVKLRETGGKVYFVPNSYIYTRKVLNFSETGYLEVQVQLTLPHQENSERAEQVLAEMARESPNVFPQKKKPSEKMVKFSSKKERKEGTAASEMSPNMISPVVRLIKSHKDGVDYSVSMWTPVPELRDQIATDYLRRSIKALKAANVDLKPGEPSMAP
jgi:small-conductance mechanosensitive channel